MNNKIKTILFASLITAMILPFSGMMADAAPNENASDKAKDRYNYKVEVLSKTITSEEIVDGMKITHFKQKVKQTDFPTVKEFKEMNADYFAYLKSELGVEGKKLQAQMIADFAKNRPTGSQVYEIDTMKFGEKSIVLTTSTYEAPWAPFIVKDPINMLFIGDGNSADVFNLIKNDASDDWVPALGSPQFIFVDETSHGGIAYWSSSNLQLEEGDFFGERYHLRLFNGGDSAHDIFGKWSVGAIHKETWNNFGHDLVSNTWEISESHLKDDLVGAPGIVATGTVNFGNSGIYQEENNNGLAYLALLS